MLITILLTLLCGITLGGLLLTILSLYLIKIKCPNCKKLKPLQQIILWHWKDRTITGQPCQYCQKPKPEIDIY